MASEKRVKRRSASMHAQGSPKRRAAPQAVDYSALARFRYELRKFQAFSEAAATRVGLTPQHHQALLAIRGFSEPSPLSVGDLAKLLLIRHHTAVELVDRMTRLQLLERYVDATDRRKAMVRLTAEGQRRLRKLSAIHLKEISAIAPTLAKILKPFRRL